MSRINSASAGPPEDNGVVKVPLEKTEPITDADKKVMKKLFKGFMPGAILGILFTATYLTLVLADWLDFSKLINTTAEDLPDLQSRLGFTLSYFAPSTLWLLGCIYAVIGIRSCTPALDPTAGRECYVQKTKNILNNSFEQFILSMVSQLMLVQYLDAEHTIKYIPALAFLFLFGRITYALGYPNNRGFGILCNMIPSTTILLYDFFKLMGLIF